MTSDGPLRDDPVHPAPGDLSSHAPADPSSAVPGDLSSAAPGDLSSQIDLAIGEDQAGMEHRRERIAIETSNHHIEGYLMIAREGYRSRVSDVLNASERDFLTLTDVTVQTLRNDSTTTHPFLAIARRHIIFAVVLGAHTGG